MDPLKSHRVIGPLDLALIDLHLPVFDEERSHHVKLSYILSLLPHDEIVSVLKIPRVSEGKYLVVHTEFHLSKNAHQLNITELKLASFRSLTRQTTFCSLLLHSCIQFIVSGQYWALIIFIWCA